MNNKTRKISKLLGGLLGFIVLMSPPYGLAQSDETDASNEEDVYTLSPFTVETDDDSNGYRATETLAGSRVKTDVRDIGSAVSIITKQLIDDLGATDNQTLLQFQTNTEVGGVYGNFAGVGNGSVLDESSKLLRPNNNTRVRGLDSADGTRDFFLSEIPWDSFNTDRIEIQRGPNSVLFGLGSPAGIINATLSTATHRDSYEFQNKFGSFGSVRNVLDINKSVIEDQLAVRVIGLNDDKQYRQDPAYEDTERVFATLRYEPEFLNRGDAKTSIRINYEYGNVKSNRPRMMPPVDGISAFFDILNGETFDPAIENMDGGIRSGNSRNEAYSSATGGFIARSFGNGMLMKFDNGSDTPIESTVGQIVVPPYVNGGNIAGLPYYRYMATTDYSGYAMSGSGLPGGNAGVYKAKSLTDTSAFNFYDHLIDGNTKGEWQDWDAYNINVSQTFFNNRLAFEGVYDHQDYTEGQETFLGAGNSGSPTLVVDINSTIITGLAEVGGTQNPNVGRVTTSTGTGENGNIENDIMRDSYRFTGTVDLRSDDFLEEGLLTKLLGRHQITGLYQKDEKTSSTRQWSRFASDVGPNSYMGLIGDGSGAVNGTSRTINIAHYFSDESLVGRNGISGLNMKGIQGNPIPRSGMITTNYFDTTWTATGVNASDPWTSPISGLTLTQGDNPANYQGWTTAQVNVLNANDGDIDQLTYNRNRTFSRITSKAFTWQGYFWDDILVGMYGYRKDEVEQISGAGVKDPNTGVASPSFGYDESSRLVNSGSNQTMSVVLHTPHALRDMLPGDTNISLHYNKSENFKADVVRGDFMGNLLPNQTGETEDYGFTITTLDNKLALKVNWYETKVSNATIGGESALGSNAWYIRQGEIWGTMVASHVIAGITQNDIANAGSSWDIASAKLGESVVRPGQFPRPEAAAEIDAQSLAAAREWLANMAPQKFWDEYGYDIDATQIQQENFSSIVKPNGKLYETWDWQPAYGGNLRSTGSSPVVTGDTTSKGVEIELVAQPLPNWNLTLNASKTTAKRVNLGATTEEYIQRSIPKYHGPAGDLPLWGNSGVTLRDWWDPFIYYPYLFLKSAEDSQAAEIRPWRANFVTSYQFVDGTFKNTVVGMAARWMDKSILGYGITQDDFGNWNLDVDKPYYSDTELAFDLWAGYSRQLNDKVNWKIQVNLSNVGDDTRLLPISVQPDGSPAAYRIVEGMTWSITNTFRF